MNDTQNNTLKQVEYLDGFQYAGGVLQFFPHAEGYVAATQGTKTDSNGNFVYIFNYVNNYTDHLGNIRLSYTKDPVSGELEIMEEIEERDSRTPKKKRSHKTNDSEQNYYYPFGLKHAVYADPKQMYKLDEEEENLARPAYVYETEYQYKFGGKELQDELNLNLYDYGARNYDPALGRWMNMDKLAEIYIKHSPFTFSLNNPIFFKDPDGNKIIIYYQDGSGKFKEYEYKYEENRKKTGNEFLDNSLIALDTLYASDALNLDTNNDGDKDTNIMEVLINSDKTLGIIKGSRTAFAEGGKFDKNKKKWFLGNEIGRLTFNDKQGFLFNNKDTEGLKERYNSNKLNEDDLITSPTAGLGHDMIHAWNYLSNPVLYKEMKRYYKEKDISGFPSPKEKRTTILSNQVNEALKEPQRNVYQGIGVNVKGVLSREIK